MPDHGANDFDRRIGLRVRLGLAQQRMYPGQDDTTCQVGWALLIASLRSREANKGMRVWKVGD